MLLNILQWCNDFYAFDYVDVDIATASVLQPRQLGQETPNFMRSWRWRGAVQRLFAPNGGDLTMCSETALELLQTDVLWLLGL